MRISCGSWIVVSLATGEAVAEIFNWNTARAINMNKYRVVCAHQYLVELNRAVKTAAHA